MKTHETVSSLRHELEIARRDYKTIGFVPTMGALHAGHRSLIDRSVNENDVTVLSVFVNPLQFGPNEDLDKYPRTLNADKAIAESAGVAHVFAPSVKEMYPQGSLQTLVRVNGLADVLEGLSRPGHFDGVATVVTKLFSIVGECKAYFGEKDWQQLAIVRQMATDLSFPVHVVGCPIVRENDGLALSSRNVYLSDEERKAALTLSQALKQAVALAADGRNAPLEFISAMTDTLSSSDLVRTEYAAVVGPDLKVPSFVDKHSRFLVAARVGATRLIDNTGIEGF